MIITVANHKGGTGKTTTVHNTGHCLAQRGYRVLLVDLDPQSNLSYSLELTEVDTGSLTLLEQQKTFSQNYIVHKDGLDVLPGRFTNYVGNYGQLADSYARLGEINPFSRLRDAYDFIFIDTPPTNSYPLKIALRCCDYVLIPMQADALSVEGIHQLEILMKHMEKETGIPISVLGILGINIMESRNLSKEVLGYVANNFAYHVFNNYIRSSVKVAEAPSHGKSVSEYAPKCTSSLDYKAFVNEMISLLEIHPEHVC
jgi:chromosome partitioning protein